MRAGRFRWVKRPVMCKQAQQAKASGYVSSLLFSMEADMATEQQIEAALDDIDEDVLVDFLLDSNELGFLMRAIVRQAMFGSEDVQVKPFLRECVNLVRDKHWELAERLAREPRLHDRRAA